MSGANNKVMLIIGGLRYTDVHVFDHAFNKCSYSTNILMSCKHTPTRFQAQYAYGWVIFGADRLFLCCVNNV